MHTLIVCCPIVLLLLMVCLFALYLQTRALHRGRGLRAKERRRALQEAVTKEHEAHEETRAVLQVGRQGRTIQDKTRQKKARQESHPKPMVPKLSPPTSSPSLYSFVSSQLFFLPVPKNISVSVCDVYFCFVI